MRASRADPGGGGGAVQHRQRAVIGDPPLPGDRGQAEIIFLPGEEQTGVIAADRLPGGAADRVAGADEGGGVEFGAKSWPQALRVAPARQVRSTTRRRPEMLKPSAPRSGWRLKASDRAGNDPWVANTASLSSADDDSAMTAPAQENSGPPPTPRFCAARYRAKCGVPAKAVVRAWRFPERNSGPAR